MMVVATVVPTGEAATKVRQASTAGNYNRRCYNFHDAQGLTSLVKLFFLSSAEYRRQQMVTQYQTFLSACSLLVLLIYILSIRTQILRVSEVLHVGMKNLL